jgi:hypothetical protein
MTPYAALPGSTKRTIASMHDAGVARTAHDAFPNHDVEVEQLRPLARVLLLQARHELAREAAGATSTKEVS